MKSMCAIAISCSDGRPREASRTAWMAPYLSGLMDDPYDAVRFIAFRSLRGLPGFSGFGYNFVAPQNDRLAAVARALDQWRRGRSAARPMDRALLFTTDGSLDGEAIARLVRQRNARRVSLRE